MIEHGSSAAGLAAQVSVAVALSTLVSGVLARCPPLVFMAVVVVAIGLFLPAAVVAVLLGRILGTAALAVLVLPVLAWGWRRQPAGLWRTARGLGGSRLLVTRALIVPSLAPFLVAALLLGAALMAVRWRLDSHRPPIILPDPVTATG